MQATGSLLAGRYRLEEVVGRGGMSTVYRATDETLGRTVAVKILLATLADQDSTYSVRFEREARAAAALANSSVVTVFDTGVDDGSHFIVMEYVEGRSLEQILREGQRFEISEALGIAVRVADALAAAHAAGILHRDIKPANVMVTETGTVKVLDFGIARRLDGTTITQVASVVGTAAYMAPERALGQPGDARADIYSLGCLLYAMLTGSPPFGGELSAAVLQQQINAEPRPPSAGRGGISPALDALVLGMLAKSPDERPATATEVRERIARLPEARGIPLSFAAPAAVTGATTPMTAATTPLAAGASTTRRPPVLADHRRRAIVMALVTALITLVAVALLTSGGTSTKPSGTRSTPTTTSTPRATTSTPSTATTPAAPKPKPKPQPKPKPKPKSAAPAGPTGGPPGHGGQPPGQAKKPGPAGNGDGGGG
jgi:eukaryotic-like serine/threonine-protein kinase